MLEKTPLGMLRSLVCQLLDQDEQSYRRFLPVFREKNRRHQKWEWRESELKEFLLSEMQVRQRRPLVILVDALDECSDSQVREAVKFLELLSITSLAHGLDVSIGLSSRHYPHITMAKYQELVVESMDEHNDDIATYVHDNLTQPNSNIEKDVLYKASGIFMWVVLVVAMLNKAYDEGKMEAMRRKLREVPNDLEELFSLILSKEYSDKQETILMLQWVLFAHRSLRPEELYYATLAGTDTTNLGPWDRSQQTVDDIKRRITYSSRGLIEVREIEDKVYQTYEIYHDYRVQFIHESVRDFLLRNRRLQSLDPALALSPVGESHDRLKICCLSYIRSVTQVQGHDAGIQKIDRNEFEDRYPFLQYASMHWMDHTEAAEAEFVSQTQFLRGEIKGYHCIQGLAEVHGHFCSNRRYVVDDYYNYRSVERTCFDEDTGWKDLLSIYLGHGHTRVARILVQHADEINPQGWDYDSAFYACLSYNDAELLRLLCEHGANPNRRYKGDNPPLHFVIRIHRSPEIVKCLLNLGADANAVGKKLMTPLGLALGVLYWDDQSESTILGIVKLLLHQGANVNARYGQEDCTALHDAIMFSGEKCVRLLLERGADVNAQGGIYGTALQAAAYDGNEDIVRLLLERGADVNAQCGKCGTALQAAVVGSGERTGEISRDIIQMLFKKGADVHAQGGKYGTALQAAISEGHEDVAVLLLHYGADINVLQTAAASEELGRKEPHFSYGKKKDMTKMFPGNDTIHITTRRKYGHALQVAILKEHTRLAILLIKYGADVNYCTDELGPPLMLAISKNNLDVATALLEHGADVNGEYGEFGTALQWAICVNPRDEFVDLLLKHHANVNARGGRYGTALQAARFMGRVAIESVLLERGAIW